MSRLTAEEATIKHATRMKGAISDMQKGIEKITIAPTEQAAAKKDKMLANLTASVNDGTWERALRSVTLEEWKKKILNKGLPRVAIGIDEAKEKMTAFYNKLLPFQDNVKSQMSRMPDLTLNDNVQRMVFFVQKMAEFKK